MPLPVLRSHDIVIKNRDLVSLNAVRLTDEQRAAIELACTEKLAEFLQRRGLATWGYRLIESDPGPDDVRYRVLPAANGRCALCGAASIGRCRLMPPRRKTSEASFQELACVLYRYIKSQIRTF
jgi:hypothetical protein